MFDIGFAELLLVAVIGLLILGPERLPFAVRKVGLWIGRIRRMVNNISQEVDRQIRVDELRDQLKKEGDTLGFEKIQETVDEALGEAKKFEHLVEKDRITETPKETSKAAPEQHERS